MNATASVSTPNGSLDTVREACEQALRRDDLRPFAVALEAAGVTRADAVRVVGGVTEDPASVAPLSALKKLAARHGVPGDRVEVERVLLLYAALEALPRLRTLTVGEDVRQLMCDEFRFFASDPADSVALFRAGTARYTAMCKVATLRRFRAGQFDWEVGAVSRSYVLQVAPRELLSVIAYVAFRMGGLGPVYFSHLAARRASHSLVEEEANRSYYRMARTMEMQPQIKGFAACSWFRSPGTHRVSPHLSWLSSVFQENGGLVVESGYADAHSGVFSRSATRKRLYEAGEFRPTRGLVLWPRDRMIEWAESHPEFALPASVRP